ncbi:MAG: transcription termination/antitermination factor NusG [Sedimentisphaerales bacterium]|nr:transcription termination/antitermination factor NusG [Sedimentisphaerales bacterium]
MTDNKDNSQPQEAALNPGMVWCVLRVATNRETSICETLKRKVTVEHLEDVMGRILVPTEKVKRNTGKQQRVYERKLYPGYVFCEMMLQEDGSIPERSWFVIKETNGVGEFIGTEGKPSPMSPADVAKMLNQNEASKCDSPSLQMEFAKDDSIKIKGGSFEGFEGKVEAVDKEKGTVRVIVTIFGRATPLDIEYWQLEKV